MDSTPIYKFSAPKGELIEPPQSAHPILTDGYEIRPAFIAMVREQTFSGKEDENPYVHIREFEQLCSCLNIPGMKHETLKWKLFSFSLSDRAKQWYAHNSRSVSGNWEELRDKFCLAFFPISQIITLRLEILNFKQKEKETIGAAWARFTSLFTSGPDLSIPDHVLLQHFHYGLSKEAALLLDTSSGGSFLHKNVSEGIAILEKILENTPYTGIYDEFPEEEVEPSPEPIKEEQAIKIELPIDSSNILVVETPPDKGTQSQVEDDETSPLEFPFEFEEDIFEDYGNTSNFPIQARPLAKTTPHDPLEESISLEHLKSLSAITSYEWLTEAELSHEVA
jgi:hypothetical protein